MPGLIIFGLLAIAGATLLLDDIPGNDALGWTFSGVGTLGVIVSGVIARGVV